MQHEWLSPSTTGCDAAHRSKPAANPLGTVGVLQVVNFRLPSVWYVLSAGRTCSFCGLVIVGSVSSPCVNLAEYSRARHTPRRKCRARGVPHATHCLKTGPFSSSFMGIAANGKMHVSLAAKAVPWYSVGGMCGSCRWSVSRGSILKHTRGWFTCQPMHRGVQDTENG